MSQLSLVVYCDSGYIREILTRDIFATVDGHAIGNFIKDLDTRATNRRTPTHFEGSVEGRPMESYILNVSTPDVNALLNKEPDTIVALYRASARDFTWLYVPGNVLHAKSPYLLETDGVIALKGSSSIKNFKHDLYAQFTTYTFGEIIGSVPAGFAKPLLHSLEDVLADIRKQKPTRLFITGHSLGGAQAAILAYLLLDRQVKGDLPFLKAIHLITLGAPKCFDDIGRNKFNTYLTSDTFTFTFDRIVSASSRVGDDQITGIPLGRWFHPGYTAQKRDSSYYTRTKGLFLEVPIKPINITDIEQVKAMFLPPIKGGGIISSSNTNAKRKYVDELSNKLSNKLVIPIFSTGSQLLPHIEAFGINLLSWARKGAIVRGMKNPGFKTTDRKYLTFMASIGDSGIYFEYVERPKIESPADEETNVEEPPIADSISARLSGFPRTSIVGGSRSRRRRKGHRRTRRPGR